MENNRAQWGTRAGFILAAVGSAVGLGNIWRFPYVAYENGGGAFFLPYLFALLTAGIPILILEFTLGHKYRGSAPLSFFRLNKKLEWVGWWQVAISFVIATYYSVIIGWAISYTFFSFTKKWGDDPGGFLIGEHLKVAAPGEIGGIVPMVFLPLLIAWVITIGILFKGVKKGIEKANKIFIPTLLVMFLIIVIRAVTLDGAAAGLDAFFAPNWDTIWDGKVWVAAYGHIFFSLSIGFAIMVTYSSYLPKKSDINNNAFITGFANSGFELLAGIGVFAALGFMAAQVDKPVAEVATAGVGLAFAVFPSIINEIPVFGEVFGVLFFLSLVFAGLSSLISICEVFIAAVQEKLNISRNKSIIFGGGAAALISILYSTKGGLNFLDVIDYFVNQFGIALAGLIEVILIAWVFKELKPLQGHANGISDIRTGAWWRICLSIVTPIVLGYMMFDLLRQNFLQLFETENGNYGGYPTSFIIFPGAVLAVAIIVIGILISLKKWKASTAEKKEVI